MEEEDKKKQKAIETTIKSKIASAIEDLCRQLGYVRTLDEKLVNKENMLVHTPVIGLHVMTQIKTLYGKARFLPLCVELVVLGDAVQLPLQGEHRRAAAAQPQRGAGVTLRMERI